ncbi:alpha/beta hydrolase [Parasphingorhabdus sp.]|uniref:alpha/beta fold hydrolase n=1 Tax=Parasphingorhabdus sp. TaxID=2709688 RepID=UPI0032651847
MSMVKRVMWGIFICISILAVFALKWSNTQVQVDRSAADPAVVHANAAGLPEILLGEKYFEHSGLNLHYVEAGQGETVIFLHGFPSYWFSFLRQVEGLKNDYHVVAVDSLGAGKSDAPLESKPYRLEAMAEHLNALIDHLGVKKVHLVGHDWGSALAIGFAQRYPDRVISVTGVGATSQNASLHILETDPESRETAKYVESFKSANPLLIVALGGDKAVYDGAYKPLVESGKLTADEGEFFRAATGDPRRINAHINWYRANLPSPDAISEEDFWPSRKARVTVPALYIWGENDQIYSQPAVDRMMSLSDDAELLMFPEIGHWPHVRKADEVTAAIRKHISTASASPETDAPTAD